MVEVVPFTGILYDQEKTGSLDHVTAPPYDVISPEQQEALHEKNPHNVVRLILGREFETDSDADNRYTRSAKTFNQWLGDGILVPDDQPGFYAYSQEYTFDGVSRNRMGFFARVKLEDFSAGNICPHEFTLAKVKKDRTLLLKACKANLSPIFGLYSDAQGLIDQKLDFHVQKEPLAVIEDGKVIHRLWKVQDPQINAYITQAFKDKKIYIADGHHRYETALAYHKAHGREVEDSAHIMMFLTNLDSDNMSIFPIHRMVRSPQPLDKEAFLTRVDDFFDREALSDAPSPVSIKAALEGSDASAITFCFYLGDGKGYRLTLRDTKSILPFLGPDEPEGLQVLGVAQLHTLVIKSILGVDTKQSGNQQYVSYTVDIGEGLERVDAGKCEVAFFMNPTRIDQVRELAEKGIRLPQKATYFYPKLLSGLVFNKFGA